MHLPVGIDCDHLHGHAPNALSARRAELEVDRSAGFGHTGGLLRRPAGEAFDRRERRIDLRRGRLDADAMYDVDRCCGWLCLACNCQEYLQSATVGGVYRTMA